MFCSGGVSQQNNINKMKGMTPQMLASQQMLAVLNQQGLSVSGVKGLNNMMLGNNVGKSGSVTIQVGDSSFSYILYRCFARPVLTFQKIKVDLSNRKSCQGKIIALFSFS